MKRLATISNDVDSGSITTAVRTGSISTHSLTTGLIWRCGFIQYKLIIYIKNVFSSDSIRDAVSKAIQEENISPPEFHKIMQDINKYCRLNEEIQKQNKSKVKEILKIRAS